MSRTNMATDNTATSILYFLTISHQTVTNLLAVRNTDPRFLARSATNPVATTRIRRNRRSILPMLRPWIRLFGSYPCVRPLSDRGWWYILSLIREWSNATDPHTHCQFVSYLWPSCCPAAMTYLNREGRCWRQKRLWRKRKGRTCWGVGMLYAVCKQFSRLPEMPTPVPNEWIACKKSFVWHITLLCKSLLRKNLYSWQQCCLDQLLY